MIYHDKRAAQEQHICHDGVLLMCAETFISMSIARTELVGYPYFLLFTALHGQFLMSLVFYDNLGVISAYFLCWR